MLSLGFVFIMLLAFSAFFSSSETALFSLSKVQLHAFKEQKAKSSSKIISLLAAPRATLVTILFGNELINVSISIVGATIVSRLFDLDVRMETIIGVGLLTPIIMICCEIVPKNIALRHAEQLAPLMVTPIHLFYRFIAPLRRVLSWMAKQMVMLFGGTAAGVEPMIMEDEFRRLVDIGHQEGVLEEAEREIIHNVFEFTDKSVGEIMTPAAHLFLLPIDLSFEKLMEELRSTQYSRVPFYEGDRSNIIGILHVRDLFSFTLKRDAGKEVHLRTLLRPAVFVETATPLEALLREFQKGRAHMAIVKDGAGHMQGLVTMDDVLEELFGEIEEP